MADQNDQEMTDQNHDGSLGRHADDSSETFREVRRTNFHEKISKIVAKSDLSAQCHSMICSFFSEHGQELWQEYRLIFRQEHEFADDNSVRVSQNALEQLQALNASREEQLSKAGAENREKDEALKILDRESQDLKDKLRIAMAQLDESDKSISKLTELKNEMRLKDQTIQEQSNQQKDLIAQHKQELARKVQEKQMLHAKIIENGREEDPYDDQHITTKFTALETEIEHLVKKHFSATRDQAGWKDYDNVRQPDDRDFFLQAHIATVLAEEIFIHSGRLFGLDERIEKYQASFEKLLQDSQVPTQEIVCWRIQTIKVAGFLASKEGHLPRTPKIPRGLLELLEGLKKVHKTGSHGKDWPSAKKAVDALFESVFGLALSLRRCKEEYEWSQTVSPASLHETDIERIDDYNLGAKGPTGRPVKILFGPVYKRVDGMPVILRHGRVLFG